MRYAPALLLLFAQFASAAQLDALHLQPELAALSGAFDGRIGVCVQTGAHPVCVRGGERFPMQSVMKLLVGVAVLEAVDRKAWRLNESVHITKQDLSVYTQPLAQLVGPSGYDATAGDLVRRAIIDSDSAAADILIARLGGPKAVQSALTRLGLSGIRIDRDERRLQTEIVGLTWRAEFVDPVKLDRAIAAVPAARRTSEYRRYRTDPRDTATPTGMAAFLIRLCEGKLLSAGPTQFILQAMKDCATGPDRLKAGLAPGWQLFHKTGTAGSWQGLTAATNDEGILLAPDGARIAVAVFVADSHANAADRAAVIAKIAALVIANYR